MMNSHRDCFRRPGGWRRVNMLLMVVMGAFTVEGQAPIEGIIAHLDSLIAVLQQAAESSELRSSSLKVTDRYMVSFLKRHVEVSELLRVNSKGKVTSEAVRIGKPGQRFRSVASQNWFTQVMTTSEPYYGNLRTRQGRHQLFWVVPVVVTSGGGQRRLAGALLAKLDLVTTLATAANRVDKPYMVEYGGKVLYQHRWKGGAGETTLFDVRGMSGLKLVTETVAPAPPVVTPAPPAPPAVSAVQPAAQARAGEGEHTAAVSATPRRGKRSGIGFFLFPVLLVIVALAAIALWRVVTRVLDAQQERLLRDIEAQVGTPSEAAAGTQRGTVDRDSLQSVSRQGGPTRRIPMPEAPVTTAPVMGMAGPAGVVGGPAAPVSQTVPPTAYALTGGTEDLELLRRQVRTEVEREVRAQLQKEFDQYRRDVERGAEAFGAEIEMTLHELIGKISEMGDNPTRLTEVTGATIHELNAIVNRYRNQNR